MSRDNLDKLRELVGRESQSQQAAVDAVDEEAARYLGVNRTDLRCLEILLRGEATPGQLGPALGLTTGSVTTMLDRLTKLDYVARHPDPGGDRRKVVVRMTETAMRLAWEIYGPIAQEGTAQIADYKAEQLDTIADFLRRSRELQERHRTRIAELPRR